MAEKLVTLVPLVTISVVREGEFVNLPINVPCEFYEKEVTDIRRAEKAEGKPMLRELQKEEAVVKAVTKKANDEI